MESILAQLPRIRIERGPLPTSGVSYWDGRCWVIGLNHSEPATRQRFTLFHELKHILDHGRVAMLYGGAGMDRNRRAEQTADYFAGCVLVSRPALTRLWLSGVQAPRDLARAFNVSERAITVRLSQVGLTPRTTRHDPDGLPDGTVAEPYYRRSLTDWSPIDDGRLCA